jgi:hypothetical protein
LWSDPINLANPSASNPVKHLEKTFVWEGGISIWCNLPPQ